MNRNFKKSSVNHAFPNLNLEEEISQVYRRKGSLECKIDLKRLYNIYDLKRDTKILQNILIAQSIWVTHVMMVNSQCGINVTSL